MKAQNKALAPHIIEEPAKVKTSNPLPHLAMALLVAMIGGGISILHEVSPWGSVILVATGAGAGYLTNKIAISMLFRPIKPRFGGRLYGMFYKRKAEFGDKLIDVSIERFVNPNLFEDMFRSEKLRNALLENVKSTLTDLLENEHGTICESLDKVMGREWREKGTDSLAIALGERACSSFAASFSNGEINQSRDDFLEAVGDKSAIRISRTKDLHLRLAHTMARKIRSSDLLEKVVDKLSDTFDEWEEHNKTLGDLIPEQLRHRMEELATGRLREWAMSVLTNYLAKKSNREWLGEMARQECERILWSKVNSLHPIKKFMVKTFGNKDLDKAIADIPAIMDGYFQNLSSYLPDSPLEKQITQAVKERFPLIWDWQVGKLKTWFSPEEWQNMLEYVAKRLNDDAKNNLVQDAIARALHPIVQKPLGQLFETHGDAVTSPEYTLSGVAEKVLQDEDLLGFLKTTFRIKARHCIQKFIQRPIADLLSFGSENSDMLQILQKNVAPRVTEALSEKAVTLVPHLPVREELEKVWSKLSNEDLKASVEGALSREFSTLINLGVSLGAITGFFFAMGQLVIA